MDDAADFDRHAEVGPAAAEVLADPGADLAAAEGDPVFAGDGDLVPPVEVGLGVVGEPAAGVVAEVVAEPAGDFRDVVGVGQGVVVRLAVGVGVPLAENPVAGLGGLADEQAAGLVGLEVVLIPLDPGREVGRLAKRVLAGATDVALVLLADVVVEPVLDLGPVGAVGVLLQEPSRPVDQVGQRGVGERLRACQVVDRPPLGGRPPRR